MFKAEYINISCICLNNTVSHSKFWSAIIRINTDGESLILKLGQALITCMVKQFQIKSQDKLLNQYI